MNLFLPKELADYINDFIRPVPTLRTIANWREGSIRFDINELYNMNLPNGTDYIIIMFEIICGFILFFNLADISVTLLILLLFLILGSLLIIYNNFDNLLKEIYTVWTFQPSMMSIVFHFTYIIMIIGIYLNLKHIAKL